MVTDIIIPTVKKMADIEEVIDDMLDAATDNHRIIITGHPASAATNRNYGLNKAKSKFVLMVDDDVRCFRRGWDARLVEQLHKSNVAMASARLMKLDGQPGTMVGTNYRMDVDIETVPALPTACIAFRNNGMRFDERYVGSGFEDNDFCNQLIQKDPRSRFVICNKVKVVHLNEMKNQAGNIWAANKAYYHSKWGAWLKSKHSIKAQNGESQPERSCA